MRLGDAEITRIGLGTNRLADTDENRRFVSEAVGAGVDFIDTAHLYTGGDSERAIGEALAPYGVGVTVATKGGFNDGRPQTLRAEFEASRERLQAVTIDLYYLHRVDDEVPLETSVEAINEFRERGALRAIGLSHVGVEEVERARAVTEIAAVQNSYTLAHRESDDVVDYCEREQIPFVPYYPLGGRGAVLSETVERIAADHDATGRQIVLAWLLKRSPVIVPIPGTVSIEHLRENLGALEIEMTDGEFEALADLR